MYKLYSGVDFDDVGISFAIIELFLVCVRFVLLGFSFHKHPVACLNFVSFGILFYFEFFTRVWGGGVVLG
jgi:hypothetical protein